MFNYLTSNAYPSPHTGQIIKSMWIHYLFPISVPKNMPNICPDPHLEDNPTNRDWLLTLVSPPLMWLSHSWPLSVNNQFRFAGCSKFGWSVSQGNPSTASFNGLKSTTAWSSNLIFHCDIPWFSPNFPSKSPVFPPKNQPPQCRQGSQRARHGLHQLPRLRQRLSQAPQRQHRRGHNVAQQGAQQRRRGDDAGEVDTGLPSHLWFWGGFKRISPRNR